MLLKRKMCLILLVCLIISQLTLIPAYATGTNSETNIALGKTATASVYYSPETPAQAVNGTYSSVGDKWCTGNTTSEKWLKLDLGSNYDINKWVVYHAQVIETGHPEYNTKDFRLQKSDDGTNWTTVDTVTNNAKPYTERRVSTFNARYVRLYIDCGQQNNNSCARIFEFQLYYTPEVNVALNKSASASDEYIFEPAANAFNGTYSNNATDKWSSGYNSNAKWLKIDLGRVYTLNRWKVVHAGFREQSSYNTKNFRLQSSFDNATWTDVDVVTNNTSSITDRTTDLFSGRYFRLYIDQSTQNDDSCARIYEFQLFNTYYTSMPNGLALGKTATASNYVTGESPSNAIDGSFGPSDSKWATDYGYGDNSWMTVDLGSTCTINKWVVISAEFEYDDYSPSTYYMTNTFKLQASNDNVNWTDIDRVVNNFQNICSRNTTAFSARYVRLFIEKSCFDNSARIYEFELYNQ